MRIVALLLAVLVVAGGLPVCRCVDHGDAECRPLGDAARDAAASGCCASEGEKAPAPATSGGGCCCIDAPPADPSAAPPAGLAPLATSLAKELAAPLYFFAAAAPVPVPSSAEAGGAAWRRRAVRPGPDVPLYRLHAALLI